MKQIRLQEQWQYGGWTSKPTLSRLEPPQYAIADDEDYDCLMQLEWYVVGDNVRGYTSARALMEFEHGTLTVTRVITMERVVMSRHVGKLSGRVYHRSRNKLDNRLANLTYSLKENEAWS